MNYKKLTSIASLLIVVVALFSCTKNRPQSEVKSDVAGGDKNSYHAPGTGYYKEFSSFLGSDPCVSFKTAQAHIFPEVTLKAYASEEYANTSDVLWATGKVNGNLGVAEISGTIRSETTFSESDLKTVTGSFYELSAGTINLTGAELTDAGRRASNSNVPLLRYFGCGDEFVRSVTLGAKVFLGLEFSFQSKAIKQLFSAFAEATEKATDSSQTLLDESQTFSFGLIQGNVKIIFEQDGGDQHAFAAAKATLPRDCFLKAEISTTSENAKYGKYVGFDHCLQAYKNLQKTYLASSFPAQLKSLSAVTPANISSLGYKPLFYVTDSYKKHGFFKFTDESSKIPSLLKDFLKGKLSKFVEKLHKAYSSYKAMESILGNTNTNATVADIKSGLATTLQIPAGGQVLEYLNSISVLLINIESELNKCQEEIFAGLKEDIEAQASSFPKMTSNLTKCDANISARERDLDSFLAKLSH